LFTWLDHDQDGKISYSDMKATVGEEISPAEEFIFR
jgi:Ca2+-binding EF-hand superfamily protein